jgi:peptide deformylase
MVKIVQSEASVLRQHAAEVPRSDIGTAKLNKIIADMTAALNAEEDGVAIAAPQIGVPMRIFVVSGKVLPKRGTADAPSEVYINPVIKKLSAKKIKMEEGCLSVRWIYGETKRADKAMVEALNEKGHRFVRQGVGLLAQIFQHEMDHLDGVLFTDKATRLHEVKPEDDQ